MTTPIFDHKNNELIVITADQRQINAIIDESEATTYIDDIPNWIDGASNPTDLAGHVLRAVAKIGSEVVGVRELEEELIRATDDCGQDLNRLCLDAIKDVDGVWQPYADLYQSAMDYMGALLHIGGMIELCYLYQSKELVGYRLEVAGRIIREMLFGTDKEVTLV